MISFFLHSPHRLFLLDGLGALLSTVMLGILAHFYEFIGMPQPVLYALALVAALFCIYSLSCFFLVRTRWRKFLWVILTANFLYGCASLAIVIYFFPLTALGLTYFVAELLVLSLLMRTEWQAVLHQ